jgi:hypothetical protein
MRAILVVLAACGGAAATSAPAPLAGESAVSAAAPSVSWIRARVAVDTTSWIEISVQGSPGETHARCKQLVADVVVVGGRRILRDCGAAELPPPPWRSPVLATIDDELAVYQPFGDLDACERARATLVADEDRTRGELERERIARTLERLSAAQRDEALACADMHAAYERCAPLNDSARSQCLLDAEPNKITCDEMTRRRQKIEIDRRARPHASRRRFACQDR